MLAVATGAALLQFGGCTVAGYFSGYELDTRNSEMVRMPPHVAIPYLSPMDSVQCSMKNGETISGHFLSMAPVLVAPASASAAPVSQPAGSVPTMQLLVNQKKTDIDTSKVDLIGFALKPVTGRTLLTIVGIATDVVLFTMLMNPMGGGGSFFSSGSSF